MKIKVDVRVNQVFIFLDKQEIVLPLEHTAEVMFELFHQCPRHVIEEFRERLWEQGGKK